MSEFSLHFQQPDTDPEIFTKEISKDHTFIIDDDTILEDIMAAIEVIKVARCNQRRKNVMIRKESV